MQRYHAGSCTRAVNNSTIGGPSTRDIGRIDSSSLPTNFPAIRKRPRAINESRVQKRKAGQVYGVGLSGSQLSKSGVFPEQRPCPEDFRKKWIELRSNDTHNAKLCMERPRKVGAKWTNKHIAPNEKDRNI
ncbi:mediator of RNA polymerase II transcription subunit [Trifolium repens]|nr:mediator of RNA polymerase II transcription subunit [Trifolium repens]